MAAEAARALDFDSRYYYGSAAPAIETFPDYEPAPQETPGVGEWKRQRERIREAAAISSSPGVSLFAIFGSVFVFVLMVFVVLAYISYNETVSETAKLNAQLTALTEQQRKLEIQFESVLDLKEIEMYARDVLGMSKPESRQLSVVCGSTGDKAEVLSGAQGDSWRDFGSFLKSLLEYLK